MLQGNGVVFLRPYHLNWKAEAGFKGYVDPVRASVCFLNLSCGSVNKPKSFCFQDQLNMICELIIGNGPQPHW